MNRRFVCSVCGGKLVVLRQVTEVYAVNERTGAIAKRMSYKDLDNRWVRCNECYTDGMEIPDDDATTIPDEMAVEYDKSQKTR
jgi:hypothetical protein